MQEIETKASGSLTTAFSLLSAAIPHAFVKSALNATLAGLLCLLPATLFAQSITTANITVTNSSGATNGSTLQINSSVWVFTNTVTTGSQILTGANVPLQASNVFISLVEAPPAFVNLSAINASNIQVQSYPGFNANVIIGGNWGTVSFATNVISTPMTVVRVPKSGVGPVERTNVASGIVAYLNDTAVTNMVATNAPAMSAWLAALANIASGTNGSGTNTSLSGVVTGPSGGNTFSGQGTNVIDAEIARLASNPTNGITAQTATNIATGLITSATNALWNAITNFPSSSTGGANTNLSNISNTGSNVIAAIASQYAGSATNAIANTNGIGLNTSLNGLTAFAGTNLTISSPAYSVITITTNSSTNLIIFQAINGPYVYQYNLSNNVSYVYQGYTYYFPSNTWVWVPGYQGFTFGAYTISPLADWGDYIFFNTNTLEWNVVGGTGLPGAGYNFVSPSTNIIATNWTAQFYGGYGLSAYLPIGSVTNHAAYVSGFNLIQNFTNQLNVLATNGFCINGSITIGESLLSSNLMQTVIPIMTATNAPFGNAFNSDTNSDAWEAFSGADYGSAGTGCQVGDDCSPGLIYDTWFAYKLPCTTNLTGFSGYFLNSFIKGYLNSTPGYSVLFQVSSDGVHWETISSTALQCTLSGVYSQVLGLLNGVNANYVRWYVPSQRLVWPDIAGDINTNYNSFVWVSNLQVYATSQLQYQAGNLISNSGPLTISSSQTTINGQFTAAQGESVVGTMSAGTVSANAVNAVQYYVNGKLWIIPTNQLNSITALSVGPLSLATWFPISVSGYYTNAFGTYTNNGTSSFTNSSGNGYSINLLYNICGNGWSTWSLNLNGTPVFTSPPFWLNVSTNIQSAIGTYGIPNNVNQNGENGCSGIFPSIGAGVTATITVAGIISTNPTTQYLVAGSSGSPYDAGSLTNIPASNLNGNGITAVGFNTTGTNIPAMSVTGYTNYSSFDIRVFELTGTSMVFSNRTSGFHANLGTITVNNDFLILHSNECLYGTGMSAQMSQ